MPVMVSAARFPAGRAALVGLAEARRRPAPLHVMMTRPAPRAHGRTLLADAIVALRAQLPDLPCWAGPPVAAPPTCGGR
jgi:hypothetical protein